MMMRNMLNVHGNQKEEFPVSLPRQTRASLPVYRASLPKRKEQTEFAAPKHIITKPT